jgi:periplasmic protein TonB
MTYEPDMYEMDAELEQMLSAVFVRLPAPDDLILRVERRLLAARRAPAVPTFGLLSLSARSVWTSVWSIAAHAGAFALIALLFLQARHQGILKTRATVIPVDVTPFLPVSKPAQDAMGGGGGGGAHDILQAPKGRLPKFAQEPIVPPIVLKNDHPKLAVDPAILMPKDLQLANNNLPNLGD